MDFPQNPGIRDVGVAYPGRIEGVELQLLLYGPFVASGFVGHVVDQGAVDVEEDQVRHISV